MKHWLLAAALICFGSPALAGGGKEIVRAALRCREDCKSVTAGASSATILFDVTVSSFVYTDRKFIMLSELQASATDVIRLSTSSTITTGFPVYPAQGSTSMIPLEMTIPIYVAIPSGAGSKTVCAYQCE